MGRWWRTKGASSPLGPWLCPWLKRWGWGRKRVEARVAQGWPARCSLLPREGFRCPGTSSPQQGKHRWGYVEGQHDKPPQAPSHDRCCSHQHPLSLLFHVSLGPVTCPLCLQCSLGTFLPRQLTSHCRPSSGGPSVSRCCLALPEPGPGASVAGPWCCPGAVCGRLNQSPQSTCPPNTITRTPTALGSDCACPLPSS